MAMVDNGADVINVMVEVEATIVTMTVTSVMIALMVGVEAAWKWW